MKDLLTSTSAAKLAGVGVSSIKRWADEGKIQAVKTPGGHRRFLKSDLLRYLNQSAVPAAPGANTPDATWLHALLSMNAFELQGALMSSRGRSGSWYKTMDELGAGVKSLGNAWAEGHVSVAEEHIASEKLARVLSNLYSIMPESAEDPVCVLACVEGDIHTLGLSMLRIVLREAGWKSVWLGALTPVDELEAVIRRENASMVALSASRSSSDEIVLNDHATQVARVCAKLSVSLVLGGSGQWPLEIRSATRFFDFESFYSFVESS